MSSQGQSGDEQPDPAQTGEGQTDEETAGEGSADDAADPPAPAGGSGGAPDAERIAEVAEHIDKARSRAEDAGVLVDEHEETFADSGTTESQDDQTIAPPG